MPDLSHKAVHQFWHSFPDPTLYKVICFMESVEDWTLDGEASVENALNVLASSLDNIGNIDLQQENPMLDLACHLKTGRGLRLLMCLDQAYPGAASKILMHAEKITRSEKDTAGIFLRRNIVFERLRLLSRVFGPDRFKLIVKTLEDGRYA